MTRTLDRPTVDRTTPDILVRFICTTTEHLAMAIPGRIGRLVTHHGTFGYCPMRAAEPDSPHAWKDIRSVRLSELRPEYPHLGY